MVKPPLIIVTMFVILVCALLYAIDLKHARQKTEAAQVLFTTEQVKDANGFVIAYIVTDRQTQTRYLVNAEGGAPIQLQPK